MFRTPFKTKRPRPMSERALKQELESLVSLITRLRMPYCCLCGESNWHLLQAGHYWHRAMPPTEFSLENLNTLCKTCNARHEYDPVPYRRYMVGKLGQEAYDNLSRLAHSQTKIGFVALMELREEMKATLEEVKRAA